MPSQPPPGDPGTQPCVQDGSYGPHPRAHAAVPRFAREVVRILETTPADEIPPRVAEAMAPLLATPDLLCDELREGGRATYRKHLLHADPQGRFTLLAIVWQPGQTTDVHGHTAWGAVGVYEGRPTVECYACHEREDGTHAAQVTKEVRCAPGDTATVRPGLADTHRIHNATGETMITLHAYGRDLLQDPDAINIHLRV